MGRYEEIQAEHVWRVPDRYNIAADCCDKHPRDKLAMVHQRFDGHARTLTWGELQDQTDSTSKGPIQYPAEMITSSALSIRRFVRQPAAGTRNFGCGAGLGARWAPFVHEYR